MTLTREEADARANAGARHLDDVRPDWAQHVEPEVMRMWRDDECVLGQQVIKARNEWLNAHEVAHRDGSVPTSSDYADFRQIQNLTGFADLLLFHLDDPSVDAIGLLGLERLVVTDEKAIEWGFTIGVDDVYDSDSSMFEWDVLTDAWRDVIRARQAQGVGA